MSIGGKRFHSTTNFIRQFMGITSKFMNHQVAAFKKAEQGVMKTTLPTGSNSLNHDNHCNLAHKPILIPQAMKIPGAKAAVDNERSN